MVIFDDLVNENSWFVSKTIITLIAEDDLSGVNSILYSFDNIKFENYIGRFNINDIGHVTITLSQLIKANVKIVNVETIKIDKKNSHS